MNKKILFWLHQELPKWKENGWISEENCDKLLSKYGDVDNKVSHAILRMMIVALSGILIALGIFFMFAGFWYEITPAGRYSLSVTLMGGALSLVALGLWLGNKSSILRESAGVIYFVITLGSMFLLNDTYYLGNSSGMCLLLTLGLTIPIAYILPSTLAMSAYLLTVAAWSGTAVAKHFYLLGAQISWVFLLLAVPFLLMYKWDNSKWTQGKIFLSWSTVFAAYVVFYNTLAKGLDGSVSLLLMANLAVITMSLGWLGKNKGFWTKPFRLIGFGGVLYVIYAGTLINSWHNVWDFATVSYGTIILAVATLIASAYYVWQLLKDKEIIASLVTMLGIVIAICDLLVYNGVNPVTITVLFNIYILIAATSYAVRGTLQKDSNLVIMAVLSILAMLLARFLDPDFTFIQRGLSFVIVGAILLLSNFAYLMRSKQKQKRVNKKVRKAKLNLQKREEAKVEVQELEQVQEASSENKVEQINSRGPVFGEIDIKQEGRHDE